MYGHNFECHFLLRSVADSTDLDEVRERVEAQVEAEWPVRGSLVPTTFAALQADVNDKLAYRGDRDAGLVLNTERESGLNASISAFWTLFTSRFDRPDVDLYVHPEIRTWVFWGFCYLIVDRTTQRSFLFDGLSSD